MTVTTSTAGTPVPVADDLVSLTIDGIAVSVPKGTLVIRAAEQLGIAIPRFCDHPLLDPAGACRQCLVEVEGQIKPVASCTTTVTQDMVVRTHLTSEVAAGAQHGVMELLLINHPLDCPVCDKGGECPLQNQAMSNGRGDSRFDGPKRTFPKPVPLSTQVLLDRERCISCTRCTRFAEQIAGDPFIELVERGASQQIAVASDDQPFNSYFSGNTVQICPVGALTGTAYRFRSRPFDLVSTPTACEHCASGCALRTDTRRETVQRRLAGDDPAVNEEWNCDKGRWAFHYAGQDDRVTTPLVRDADGKLVPASWPEAVELAARGLAAARDGNGVGVLVGGRATLEDSYAYAKFARVVLGTNDVDFRARPHSAEEADFLGAVVAGRGVAAPGTATYADLERAPVVLLAGLEPEEESPIVFLRLRKAARAGRTTVASVAPFGTRGLRKAGGRLLPALPGQEASVLRSLAGTGQDDETAEVAELLRRPGAVVLAGERLAESPGALSAVAALVQATGAALGWVPRRAGERGAVEAGALPGLLPGGRPVSDAEARVDAAAVWGVEALPTAAGRDTGEIVAAASSGQLAGLVVGGVDPGDLADPVVADAALSAVGFLVSLELRHSGVTEHADVVLPIAPVAEKAGTFLDWEGRSRSFPQVLRDTFSSSDAAVLTEIAEAMGSSLGLRSVDAARSELAEFEPWGGARLAAPGVAATPRRSSGGDDLVLATWSTLLDAGRLQDGEPYLAGTAKPAVALMSEATAKAAGASPGGQVTVRSATGELSLPVEVGDVPDGLVWVPTNAAGSPLRRALRTGNGASVTLGGAS